MAKGDHGKGGSKTGAAAPDDKAAKANRRRAKRIVKVEVQLADAREIQAAVGALVASLERKLADLQAPAQAPSPASTPAASPAAPARRATRPRTRRAAPAKPRVTRARAPRKTTPPA